MRIYEIKIGDHHLSIKPPCILLVPHGVVIGNMYLGTIATSFQGEEIPRYPDRLWNRCLVLNGLWKDYELHCSTVCDGGYIYSGEWPR